MCRRMLGRSVLICDMCEALITVAKERNEVECVSFLNLEEVETLACGTFGALFDSSTTTAVPQ